MMKSNTKWLIVILISLTIVLLIPWDKSPVHGAGDGNISPAYPPPSTPIPTSPAPVLPTPTPTTTPPETEIALNYIATREGIPVERLFVANQHRREYGLLGRDFWFVKALDQQSGHFYTAMVDLDDHSVAELEEIERAQREAREARYGKLEPQLYELLQTKEPEDEVKVAIWFTPVDFQAILAQLKARYPQVASRLSLERPWRGVTDKALAAQIRADYLQLLEEAHLAKQNPLAQGLRTQGHELKTHRGTPSLSAKLPKRVILQIEQRSDVSRIYLIEGKLVPLLDTAIPTARGNVVWDRGFEGAGVRIAIVEAGIVEVGHPSINVVAARQVVPPSHHTAGVASAAASHHPTYKGIAPEAEIVSAGVNGQADQWDDVDDAILWALNNYGTAIMNASFSSNTGERSDEMQWIDRVFDYYARYDQIIFTVAAGNQRYGNHIGSPGKAYNVITVGGTDDRRNSAWYDDAMAGFSAWKNPKRDDGSYGDREKPEVVASATNLTILNLDNGTWVDNGTSYSSPQVAGLAALLCQRNSELCDAPEAMKAIIMASAVHNIDGPSNIPTGQDLRDGAGAIDAALADTTAITGFGIWGYPYPACERPCWWSDAIYNYLPGDPPHFPPGTYRYYKFKASAGERIRVALTWVSHPAGPGSNYWQDPLETDLDLRIFDPDWQALDSIGGLSASNDNNYELVEFTAPKTGEYKIGVYKKPDVTEVTNWLGLAWTKEATYLPDVKSDDQHGWDSEIIVRNDSPVEQKVSVSLFFEGGGDAGGIADYPVRANESWVYNPAITGFSGSAVVNAGESVSVIVKTQNRGANNDENNITAYNGILPEGASGDPGWEQTGTELYAPMVKRNWVNRWSEIYVMNVGTGATDVHVTYYGENGFTHDGGTRTLQPGQRTTFSPEGYSWQNLHSAYITSANPPQPLAALVMEHNDNPYSSKPNRSLHNVFRQGRPTLYAPLVKKDWGSPAQRTGLTIQNVGTGPTDVRVYYYDTDGNNVLTLEPGYQDTNPPGCLDELEAKYWCVVYNPADLEDPPEYPGKFLGSARVESDREDIVGMVHENTLDTGRFMSHLMALADNSKAIYSPRQGRLWSEDGAWWNAAFMIMNVGSWNTQVTVKLYDENGDPLKDQYGNLVPPITKSLDPYQAFTTWPEMPTDLEFKGSAIATAGQPIVAEVNLTNYGSGDTGASFNGANR